jgi:hypothetical protein
VVAHYAAINATLDSPPVLVGHSFGGMIAEKLLGQGLAAGAVAIDAAQIKGVLALPLSAPPCRSCTTPPTATARSP